MGRERRVREGEGEDCCVVGREGRMGEGEGGWTKCRNSGKLWTSVVLSIQQLCYEGLLKGCRKKGEGRDKGSRTLSIMLPSTFS